MDAYRLIVKLYFEAADEIDLERFIPVFHRWIQNSELDELLIDVADYRHVPDGPGVMLIAHEGHYGLDASDGRLGLLYARKRPAAGSFADRLRDSLDKVLRAARRLEREGLAVPGDRWALAIYDRLLAPNNEETFAAVEPDLRALASDLYGETRFELRREEDPEAPFGVRIEAAEKPGVATLLERLQAAALPVAV